MAANVSFPQTFCGRNASQKDWLLLIRVMDKLTDQSRMLLERDSFGPTEVFHFLHASSE